MFKKKKPTKEEIQAQETATVADKQEKPDEEITQGKLLVEMTEPERFTLIYGELSTIRGLLEELITIAKEE